jgi:hypothetical protein
MPANKIARFFRKPLRDKIQTVRSTITYLTDREDMRERVRLRKITEGTLVAPRVLTGTSQFYLAYRPVSEAPVGAHPEIAGLSEAWVANNVENNAGDLPRLYALVLNVKQVISDSIDGHFAELGVYRGNSAAVLAHYARANGRQLYLFDTFEGFDPRDLARGEHGQQSDFADTSMDLVQGIVGMDNVHWVKGFFPASIPPDAFDAAFSVAHLDCDLYEPMKAGLEFFYPRLSPGGLLIVHDYANPYWAGVQQAVDEFLKRIPERLIVLPDKSGTAMLRKSCPA